ncbi:hypothetical protein GWK47_039991 [Chionoecetes opilio]|uniref:Uncharacterized protein n=1 Tax=Chionoecetes opilio TaxID=41210 RepID=A0A8J5D140_CHIOP|nr:hypothetical protein GWK47_039991 [Chionoecetes opilio]
MDLHSNKQMYSCGSLAPRWGEGGGGCSDCRFPPAPQVWERADGGIYLAGELAAVPRGCGGGGRPAWPWWAEAVGSQATTPSHVTLLETLCPKSSHTSPAASAKRVFKSHLHLFLDTIFYALVTFGDLFLFVPTLGLPGGSGCQCLHGSSVITLETQDSLSPPSTLAVWGKAARASLCRTVLGELEQGYGSL